MSIRNGLNGEGACAAVYRIGERNSPTLKQSGMAYFASLRKVPRTEAKNASPTNQGRIDTTPTPR
ncbi:hypothetical protein D3C71_2132570 [compost metagenome]